MAYVSWSDNLSVGNVFIDADHRKMFDIINCLHDAMRAQQGQDVLEQVLFDLVVYTKGHFMREEDFMKTIGFPGLDAHRQEHELLLWKVIEQHNKLKAGKANLSIEVAGFLRAWLTDHIQGSDMEVAAFAAEWKKHAAPRVGPSWTVQQLAAGKE